MKLIRLLLGLAIGFGGGVYWGVHHPTQASDLSKKEEEWVAKGKLEATQAITQKLDQILNNPSSPAPTPPGVGFAGGGSVLGGGGGSGAATTDALRQLRDEKKKEIQDLEVKAKPK